MNHYDDVDDEVIHAKVVLLGSAGVGKTCLVIKYKTGNFPTMATPTIGASYMAKTVYVAPIHSPISVSSHPVLPNVYPVYLQCVYHSLYPLHSPSCVVSAQVR